MTFRLTTSIYPKHSFSAKHTFINNSFNIAIEDLLNFNIIDDVVICCFTMFIICKCFKNNMCSMLIELLCNILSATQISTLIWWSDIQIAVGREHFTQSLIELFELFYWNIFRSIRIIQINTNLSFACKNNTNSYCICIFNITVICMPFDSILDR